MDQAVKFPIKVTIPQYIRKVKVSDRQRATYYEITGDAVFNKKKTVPVKYVKPGVDRKLVNITDLRYPACIRYKFRGKFYKSYPEYAEKARKPVDKYDFDLESIHLLFDEETNSPVIANRTKAGEPRMVVIRGQDFYNGNLSSFVRVKVMDAIKEQMAPYVATMPYIKNYPIKITLELYDTVRNELDPTKQGAGSPWDVDNRCYPYAKAFPDLLSNGFVGKDDKFKCHRKIDDDNRLFITGPPAVLFCPIENSEDRKLVFIIEQDDRKIIQDCSYYKDEAKNYQDLSSDFGINF